MLPFFYCVDLGVDIITACVLCCMDALRFDGNKEGIEVKSAEGGCTTSDVSDMDDKFGEPEVVPRVGDQYQAEIPSLTVPPYLSQRIKKKNKRDSDVPEFFESVSVEEGQVFSENECGKIKVESRTAVLSEGENVGRSSNLPSSSRLDETVINSHPEQKAELDNALLPGLLSDQSWTDIEYNSFLLGLYVFGKNLKFLKRFVGSKNMGNILSFYYGKFYRSEGYCRWSRRRKLRDRRCIYGQKIFSGWRQQELLSRLFSRVSGECQTVLVELTRNFGYGKMPFEEYVFALKDTAGVELLVAVVGIGKGKQDLTGTAAKPTKTNHVFAVRPELPIGKACSSLTPADIIKVLTGDFRLSKARSSDLFWGAVWPRLIAKGWHSEQPKDHVSGSKQSLVFLIPGVKKFSRKRLVKGDHYFDSISDVLNKVASDPGLLEKKIQAIEGSVDRENSQDVQDLDGLSNKPQFCYLQPVSSKCQDLEEFTVIDTTIVCDLDQCKVRQQRSSPFQTRSHSCASEQGTSQEIEDQAEQPNSSNPVEEFSDKLTNIVESSDCNHIPEALNTTKEEDEHSREINEDQSTQNVTMDCSKHSPSIMEKQKLADCKHGEFNHCTESTFIEREFDLNVSYEHDESEVSPNISIARMIDLNVAYQSDESEVSPDISIHGNDTKSRLLGEVSAERAENSMLIDLNLPPDSSELEIETEAPTSMVMLQHNDSQCENTYSSPSEITLLSEKLEFPDGHKEQQSTIVNCRQGTRYRPLTTKALEALEYRFINSKRKRKNGESSHNNSKSQCLLVSSGTIISAACDNGMGNVMADTRAEKENVIRAYSGIIDLNNEPHYNL
ncbi:hypothetical protein RIF29_23205 [Crotalaria pallida]|uniref:SANT domain-containing protein n=1 Tax=Crotalaria pallida TaxID=3830 RepID=A0AAN9F7G5_CROPI